MYTYIVYLNDVPKYATKDLEYALEHSKSFLLKGKEGDPYYYVDQVESENEGNYGATSRSEIELVLYSRPRFLWVSYDCLESVIRIVKLPLVCRKGDSSDTEHSDHEVEEETQEETQEVQHTQTPVPDVGEILGESFAGSL